MNKKTLFIDRDGTLISEPKTDFQIDSIDKLKLEPYVITVLLELQKNNFKLVMITNQDGLGTPSFPQDQFDKPHNFMMAIFESQNIFFDAVLICPHLSSDNCKCRKPMTGLVKPWLEEEMIDKDNSYVIGDRKTDIDLANAMGITGLQYHRKYLNWQSIGKQLINHDRHAEVNRITQETSVQAKIWLDRKGDSCINTGIGFFDHMLNQIATHSGFSIKIEVKGDLNVDDHHTVEDTALAIGEVIKNALGKKIGIARFGFVLPMDECLTSCTLDLSGRPYLDYQSKFNFQKVGDLSTEMIEHFFRSITYAMACTLHLTAKGDNDHHKAESLFKAFGRALHQAIRVEGETLPSSKGVL